MIDKRPADSPVTPATSADAADPGFPRVTTAKFGRHEILQITLDTETVEHLRQPKTFAHVRDEAGKVIGVLKLMSEEEADMYQYALDTVDFDQLDKPRDPSRPGRTWSEIRAELEAGTHRTQQSCVSQ